jgi:hypothetical protein
MVQSGPVGIAKTVSSEQVLAPTSGTCPGEQLFKEFDAKNVPIYTPGTPSTTSSEPSKQNEERFDSHQSGTRGTSLE